MKTTILVFSISLLLILQILNVEATNKTIQICDNIHIPDCTEQNVIVQNQSRQISELNDKLSGFENIEISSLVIGVLGFIVGIIGTIYGKKKKKQLTRSQLRTEQVKRSAYRSTKEAKDAEKINHYVDCGKKFWDWFTG